MPFKSYNLKMEKQSSNRDVQETTSISLKKVLQLFIKGDQMILLKSKLEDSVLLITLERSPFSWIDQELQLSSQTDT